MGRRRTAAKNKDGCIVLAVENDRELLATAPTIRKMGGSHRILLAPYGKEEFFSAIRSLCHFYVYFFAIGIHKLGKRANPCGCSATAFGTEEQAPARSFARFFSAVCKYL